MHPEYPDLEARFALSWKESKNVPVQPLSPDWEFPMLDAQLFGDDLQRLNNDLKNLVLEHGEKMSNHTRPSRKAQHKHPNYDLTATFEDWNFFYIDHPAAECLFYFFKQAHDAFADKLDIAPGMPTNILCWANALKENSTMGEHSHQGKVEATYMSGNYCVTADEDTATVFDTPGFNSREIHVRNKPGQLTMFPQWVNHWTTPFERDDVRVTIAADIDIGHYSHLNYDAEFDERSHYLPLDHPPHEKARRKNASLDQIPAADPQVIEFVNTPVEELRENDLVFNFEGHK